MTFEKKRTQVVGIMLCIICVVLLLTILDDSTYIKHNIRKIDQADSISILT